MRSNRSFIWPLLLLLAACDDDPAQPAGDVGDDPDTGTADVDSDSTSDAQPDVDSGPDLPDLPELPEGFPTAADWMAHLEDEILPYWTMEAALGDPVGNFPTFRCDDGTVYDAEDNRCPELANADTWIRSELGRQYVRMMSRQTYLYGAAYHLTGDEALFELHQAGVDILRERALDPAGGAFTWFDADGNSHPEADQRTSQDLAYAALGLAMNVYLTRDPAVLEDVVALKDYIFDEYWDDALGTAGGLRWTRSNSGGEEELVSQLDQINAYMLLLSRALPDADRDAWNADIERLLDVLIDDYYSEPNNLFWGAIHEPSRMTVGSFHTDFGHTIKAMWMIYVAGRLLDDPEHEQWAAERIPDVLEVAYIADEGPYQGAWAEKLSGRQDPLVWPGTEWWSYIELDQTAATLSLVDPAPLAYLATTYPVYFERMVDHEHGGVYHFVSGEDTVQFAKAHLWKNGYHELEHIVVGYITGQALRGEPAELWFAFADDAFNDVAFPYFYEATEASRTVGDFEGVDGFSRTRVTFTEIR